MQILIITASFVHQYSHFKVSIRSFPLGGSLKCPQSIQLLM